MTGQGLNPTKATQTEACQATTPQTAVPTKQADPTDCRLGKEGQGQEARVLYTGSPVSEEWISGGRKQDKLWSPGESYIPFPNSSTSLI